LCSLFAATIPGPSFLPGLRGWSKACLSPKEREKVTEAHRLNRGDFSTFRPKKTLYFLIYCFYIVYTMNVVAKNRCRQGLVILCAVLLLPWGSLAWAGAPQPGCGHCYGLGSGIMSGHCCPSDMPVHCGGSGQGGMSFCRCSSGNQPFLTSPPFGMPTWQDLPYTLAVGSISSKPIIRSIFHPPEPTLCQA
jgi:hypothetical protein